MRRNLYHLFRRPTVVSDSPGPGVGGVVFVDEHPNGRERYFSLNQVSGGGGWQSRFYFRSYADAELALELLAMDTGAEMIEGGST